MNHPFATVKVFVVTKDELMTSKPYEFAAANYLFASMKPTFVTTKDELTKSNPYRFTTANRCGQEKKTS